MPLRSLRRSWTSALLAVSIATGAYVYAQPAKVAGTIAVGDMKITAQAGSAVGYKGPGGQLISVLIADKAADPREFAERTAIGAGEVLVPGIFEGAWKGLHLEKALSGVVFTIDGERRMLSVEFLVGGDPLSTSPDDFVLELTSVAPRLTGRLRTKTATLELGSYRLGLDVTFDVPVSSPGK